MDSLVHLRDIAPRRLLVDGALGRMVLKSRGYMRRWQLGLAVLVLILQSGVAGAAKPAPVDVALQSDVLEAVVDRLASFRMCDPDRGDQTLDVKTYVFDKLRKMWDRNPTKVGACRYLNQAQLIEFVAYGALFHTTYKAKFATDDTGKVDESTPESARAALKKLLPGLVSANDPATAIAAYKPAAVKDAFAKLYFGPKETRALLVAQAVYDTMFKAYVTKWARDIATVLQKVPAADQVKLAKAYKDAFAKGKADSSFYAPSFLHEQSEKISPPDAQGDVAINYRALGFVLRRQMDGSLPTVRAALTQVIKDYDPKLFEEIGDKL